jgi:hypothetical protein
MITRRCGLNSRLRLNAVRPRPNPERPLPAKRRPPTSAAKRFVLQWLELVSDGAKQIASVPAARQLVEERERRLKTSQSRYSNRAVRDRWAGASGVDRLSFRWSQAKSHLRDLAHAE